MRFKKWLLESSGGTDYTGVIQQEKIPITAVPTYGDDDKPPTPEKETSPELYGLFHVNKTTGQSVPYPDSSNHNLSKIDAEKKAANIRSNNRETISWTTEVRPET